MKQITLRSDTHDINYIIFGYDNILGIMSVVKTVTSSPTLPPPIWFLLFDLSVGNEGAIQSVSQSVPPNHQQRHSAPLTPTPTHMAPRHDMK